MSKQAIEQAKSPDLRLSLKALQRASHSARKLAEHTGTSIVISRNGMLEWIEPVTQQVVHAREIRADYKLNE